MVEFQDVRKRRARVAPARTRSKAIAAWPTWCVAAAIYGGWGALTFWHAEIPTPVMILVGGWLIAWQGSLQHETIHGHPSGVAAIDWSLGFPPLTLYLPYALYRETHLAHHRDGQLTDPLADPESFYVAEARWRRLPAAWRLVLLANQTLLGRLVIGPLLMVGRLWAAAMVDLARGDRRAWRVWLGHAVGVALVLAWVLGVCAMPVEHYVGFIVYPGIALGLVRSFAEHRAAERPGHRTIIVEAGPVFSLLFLGNNLHALHHAEPTLPWFKLFDRYEVMRESLARRNGGYVHQGYSRLLLGHLVRPIYHPVHPILHRDEAASP